MNSPLVSIIMPLYNAEQYVAAAIESVINQTYANWELIIVDDESKDSSLAKAKAYESDQIKIFSKPNAGAAAARNYGYERSSGAYIKFLDSDDLINPAMLAAQIALAEQYPGTIISGKWGRFYHDEINTFTLAEEDCWQSLEPVEWIQHSWRNGQSMTQSGMFLLPRILLEKAGVWNEKLSLIDDFEYFTRSILSSKRVIFCEEAILYYRSGIVASLSDQKSVTAIKSAFNAIQLGTAELLNLDASKLSKLCCANIWQGFVYEFYLADEKLIQYAEKQILELGGSDLEFPSGGITRLLTYFLSWKTILKVKKWKTYKLPRFR